MHQIALLLFLISSSPAAPLQKNLITDAEIFYGSQHDLPTVLTVTAANEPKKTISLEDSIQELYSSINLKQYDLSYEAFHYGMIGYFALQQQGKLNEKNLITIIDFTKPSTQKRFYTIDLATLQVKYHTFVSHGKNTGENMAKAFSNRVHSNQSSLGFYITAETYTGSKGYSLKLDGMDKGYNDNIRQRAVVMHEAAYVSESWIRQYGRLGRSQGCPALPRELSKEVIDTIKGGTIIFAYYKDDAYLRTSSYLKEGQAFAQGVVTADQNTMSGSN